MDASLNPAPGSFGTLLRRRRLALGLSQEELADRSGLSVRAIANMEQGRTTRPHRHSVESLADALGLPEPERLQLDRASRATGNEVAGPAQQRPVPHQLPAAVAGFVGRGAELETLGDVLADTRDGSPGTVAISVICGTAGVGKTSLALHWAHQAAGQFEDGQLHVDLRGFDPSGKPVTASQAIRRFLDALGVPPEHLPAGPDAQAGLYRSLLAGKRMLIVLDNARDEQQVRPLMPASPGSLVIVTSRNQLSGLAAADCARLLTLDVLAHGEAVEMLTARLGASRAAADTDAISRIAGLCACLPLALAVSAARAASRPDFPLAVLAAELGDSVGRLDALDAGDPAASVRAVFSWSYQQLSINTARMFRLLGQHPAPDISVPAAASLAAMGEAQARHVLGDLARDCLIAEHVPGRYALHDLLRVYAASQAEAIDSEPDRTAAIGRILDHYLHTAQRADQFLKRVHAAITPLPALPGVMPEEIADYEHAVAWFQAEHRVLPVLVEYAAEAGFDIHAWQLAELLTTFFDRRGYWDSLQSVQQSALGASVRLGDERNQAIIQHRLGQTSIRLGKNEAARAHFAKALDLYRQLGDHLGQGRVHISLGALSGREGSDSGALEHSRQALTLFQAAGDLGWQATVINNIGWCHAQLGEYEQAQACARQAISLHQELGKRESEGCAWDSLGYAHAQLGQHGDAFACYQRALAIFRELGDRFNEADVLTHLGDLQMTVGDLRQARQTWQLALAILDELRHPDAASVRTKLASSNGHSVQPAAGPVHAQ